MKQHNCGKSDYTASSDPRCARCVAINNVLETRLEKAERLQQKVVSRQHRFLRTEDSNDYALSCAAIREYRRFLDDCSISVELNLDAAVEEFKHTPNSKNYTALECALLVFQGARYDK